MINQQQEQVIEGTIEELDKWWKEATSSIFQTGQFIHCVEIDGKSFYNGYEQYLLLNVNQIKGINIQTLSKTESILSTEQSLDEYLDRFIPGALGLADQLFGNLSAEQQQLLAQLVEGLDWIGKALQFAGTLYADSGSSLPEYADLLEPFYAFVNELFEAINQDDYVGVADLLQYEIVPLLERFRNRSAKRDLS
ncbi:hypothetical protein HMSSN036_23570 [Paenibacillus macerans]|nr:hypothetical protein HMSSN036_23570 [Paenibacillus macerans]